MAILTAREAQARLKGKVDPEVLFCFKAILEQQSVYRHQLVEMAQQMDRMTDILMSVVQVGENMKNMVDTMKGMNPDDDLPPTIGSG